MGLSPVHSHDPFRLILVRQARTALFMDGYPPRSGDEPHYRVSGNGIAALSDAGKQISHAQHRDSGGRTGKGQIGLDDWLLGLMFLTGLGKAIGQLAFCEAPGTQVGEKFVHIVELTQGHNLGVFQLLAHPAEFTAQ